MYLDCIRTASVDIYHKINLLKHLKIMSIRTASVDIYPKEKLK